MSTVKRFEDLQCWQAARILVKEVYLLCETEKLSKDFETKWQLKKAALSTMNNIAEGFGRFSPKEFLRFLDFSQSSALEVESMIYVLEDLEYLPLNKIKSLRAKTLDTKALTLGLIRYLTKTKS